MNEAGEENWMKSEEGGWGKERVKEVDLKSTIYINDRDHSKNTIKVL